MNVIAVSSDQLKKYMLFAGWEVRIVKNCDRGLENAARGRRKCCPRSQFFTKRTDPKPVNKLFIFFLLGKKKKKKKTLKNRLAKCNFIRAHPMLNRSLSYGKSEE